MILNENDMVVGATFENGTIQDYIDEHNTYGLVRIKESTCKWFLFNKDESELEIQTLYKKVISDKNHFIQDDFGEEIVLFEKTGEATYSDFINQINAYLDYGLENMF